MRIGKLIPFLVLTVIVIVSTSHFAEQAVQQYGGALPPLIRLHIIANSDSEHDQGVKIMVRDSVLEYLQSSCCAENADVSVSRRMLKQNMQQIRFVVDSRLQQLGEPYKSQVQLGIFNFPAKTYNNFALPAGKYEALNIILGEGEGRNWWCVVFPALCFAKETVTLSEEEVHEITVRFKLAELIKLHDLGWTVEMIQKQVEKE